MRCAHLCAGLTLSLPLLALSAPGPLYHSQRDILRVFHTRAAKNDPQSSPTLDKSQIQAGLQKDGQQNPAPGQVASLTSANNFINFCLTQKNVPLTNGAQIKTGSCNPTIMGRIIAQDVMPATKFLFPPNMDQSIEENQSFTIKLVVSNLQTGNFVNAESNYFAAPAQVNNRGHLIGHSHVVIQAVPSLSSTDVPDPRKFAFFQGLNAKASNSVLTATVKNGLPAGVYRLGSITTAANHQPALVAVAQHGMLDDTVYFTVKEAGKGKGNASNGKSKNRRFEEEATDTEFNFDATVDRQRLVYKPLRSNISVNATSA